MSENLSKQRPIRGADLSELDKVINDPLNWPEGLRPPWLRELDKRAEELADAQERIAGLEAQNLALIERNERLEFREMELREALGDMMNEHTPLGQHPNGEIEYCNGSACARAQAALAKAPYQPAHTLWSDIKAERASVQRAASRNRQRQVDTSAPNNSVESTPDAQRKGDAE